MEAITSFFDNIKQKVTNPFFGTFILVWLIRNWELVYTLFNFDEGSTLATKKIFIINYLNERIWAAALFNNVCIAIIVMIGGYILIVATRVLVNVVEFRLMPNLNKHTVSKLVTNTEVFNEVIKERDDVADKYEKEKEKNRKLVTSFDSQKASYEEIISEKDKMLMTEKIAKEKVAKENLELITEIEKQKTEVENHKGKIIGLESSSRESKSKEAEAKLSLVNTSTKFGELEVEYDTLKKIFLTVYSDYDLLSDEGRKQVEDQIPDTIYLPFLSLKEQNIDQPFFQIVEMIMTSSRINQTSFDNQLIEKFEALGLMTIHGQMKNRSYTGENVSLTQLAKLVIELENILETKYTRRF